MNVSPRAHGRNYRIYHKMLNWNNLMQTINGNENWTENWVCQFGKCIIRMTHSNAAQSGTNEHKGPLQIQYLEMHRRDGEWRQDIGWQNANISFPMNAFINRIIRLSFRKFCCEHFLCSAECTIDQDTHAIASKTIQIEMETKIKNVFGIMKRGVRPVMATLSTQRDCTIKLILWMQKSTRAHRQIENRLAWICVCMTDGDLHAINSLCAYRRARARTEGTHTASLAFAGELFAFSLPCTLHSVYAPHWNCKFVYFFFFILVVWLLADGVRAII